MQDNQSTEIAALTLEYSGNTCVKCSYKRQPADNAPEWACPSCGVAYVKSEAAAREEQARLSLQNRMERLEFAKEQQKLDPKQQAQVSADKAIAKQIYILIFLSGFTGGITFFIALALAHKHHNSTGQQNWVHTHFAWQVRSFWYTNLWVGIGGTIVLASFLFAIKNSFKDGLGNGYEVYGQLFGWMFDPIFLKGLAVGGTVVVVAALWHLARMIKGYRALQRNEHI